MILEGTADRAFVFYRKMKPVKKSAANSACDMTFEQAIARLEKIVADMEAAELPLDDVLKRYEEGTRLVRFCGQKLEEAEKKIELLTRKCDGSVELTPFEEAADQIESNEQSRTATDASRAAEDSDNDDAKLF